MTIKVSPCQDPYCQGYTIDIDNLDDLAKAVALVLAQQYSAAKRIVDNKPSGVSVNTLEIDADSIIQERLRTTDNQGTASDQVRFQRDGLLFQIITWLASHCDAQTTDVIQKPHVQQSSKGFDSSIVHLQNGTQLAALTICEDKATDSPRDLIRVQVWPEIEACELGKKDDLLRTTLIDALIRRGVTDEVAEATAGSILWSGHRRYRIRTTVGTTHRDPPERGHLFKDYDVKASGHGERRRGDTMFVANLRAWMNDLSTRVETALRELEK